MRTTEKIRAGEKRSKTNSAKVVGEMALERHNERMKNKTEVLVPVGKGKWRVEYV